MRAHAERHRAGRANWLRAAVLGANDGLLSTASLIVGIAASGTSRSAIVIAGLAGMVAGAFSMAAGEYVSVSSQADLERADLALEQAKLAQDPAGEEEELAGIYRARGLTETTARLVARELTQGDALAAHARDELGITERSTAHPLQAALASAAAFAAGALLPLTLVLIAPASTLLPVTVIGVLAGLILLGTLGAAAGGARIGTAALRVALWGMAAMAATGAIGHLAGRVL